MKIIKFSAFLLIITLSGCGPSEKKDISSPSHSMDSHNSISQLTLYNDVLNQLVADHTYDKYLGCKADELQRKLFIENTIDSATYINKKKLITHDILHSDHPPTILYVKMKEDSSYNYHLDKWFFLKNDSTVTSFFQPFSPKEFSKIATTLRYSKTFSKDELQSSLTKILPDPTYKKLTYRSCTVIGSLSMSHVYINETHHWALLLWGFRCGPKCGRSELLKIKKEDGQWKIIATHLLAIM